MKILFRVKQVPKLLFSYRQKLNSAATNHICAADSQPCPNEIACARLLAGLQVFGRDVGLTEMHDCPRARLEFLQASIQKPQQLEALQGIKDGLTTMLGC
jgi:hypothetical protein